MVCSHWSRSFDPDEYISVRSKVTDKQLRLHHLQLHVGTFTCGSRRARRGDRTRLDHLVQLGIDFVEADAVERLQRPHNWGYDGVLWYAVHEAYRRPLGYMRLSMPATSAGLGVIQDVVYNHLRSHRQLPVPICPLPQEQCRSLRLGRRAEPRSRGSDEVRRYVIDVLDVHHPSIRWTAYVSMPCTLCTTPTPRSARRTEYRNLSARRHVPAPTDTH